MESYVQAPVSVISTENHNLNRRSANYHPSIWGEHFLAYFSDNEENSNVSKEERQLQQLKEEVRKLLIATSDKSKQKLDLIDTIQRLGISYHFENDVEESLMYVYNMYDELNDEDGNDLYSVALRFRLLRQQGHYVSCDVFNKFKNPNGNFKESLTRNARGMLSLYEAANFRVHGEDILEEALRFTTFHLESMTPKLSNFLATKVIKGLKLPIQKTMTRLGATQFMSLYQEDVLHDEVLLNFAKLDFNILQKQHRKELSGITEWWKALDCAKNLPFARDRLVECYFWILGVYFEPKYSFARKILTKVIALASIFDDVYDLYGTLDELTLFTDAIERWHMSALDQLPSYMKHCYRSLLDVYSEMEEELAKEGISDHVHYAKIGMKDLIRAYFEEAKWFHSGHVPNFEEYMKVALVSGGYTMLASNSLVCMGELATKESIDFVSNEPLIVRAANVICRLMNDMVTCEVEKERGEVASAVESYMNQYGASKQEAFDELQKRVTNAWKDINKECLNPTSVLPMPLLERILNLSRMIHLLYKDADYYANSSTKLKDLITSVLVDPVTI